MFQTKPALWFEIVVAQDDLPTAMEALAGLNAIELETKSREHFTSADLSGLRSGIEEYADLARRYRSYWPEADYATPMPSVSPAEIMSDVLERAHGWAIISRPHITKLQEAVRHEADFVHLGALIEAVDERFPMSFLSGESGELFETSLHLLDDAALPDMVFSDVLTTTYETDRGTYIAAVGTPEGIAHFAGELAQIKARQIFLPQIDIERMEEIPDLLAHRVARLRDEQNRARAKLDELSSTFDIAHIRANVERLRWLADHVGFTSNTALFTRITGWSGYGPAVLKQALELSQVAFALSVSDPPKGLDPPQLFSNARWVRPFEIFVRLLGTPGKGESDPSPLVALIAPLLFGFMFGDVGQGLVLFAAGLWLKRKWPATAILVPGGLFSVLFGFAFGSVFAREDVIEPLWLHPLLTPIPVLSAALVIGASVLLAGLVLNNRQAHWQRQEGMWWRRDGGLVLAYLGLLATPFSNDAFAVSAIGMMWFLLGHVSLARRPGSRWAALGVGAGELVERLFQILINTLSFVRVGAFAIAHAGLSSAVVILADISGGAIGFWVVMVAGNAFIIALEGLVTGIQTTRLVLFEFFIRFLRAEGRSLRALPTPAMWATKVEGGTI